MKTRPSSCLDLLLEPNTQFLGIDCDDNNEFAPADPDLCADGGGITCETPNVEVGWVNGEVSEDSTRLCVPAMIQEQGTDGSYTCAVINSVEDVVTFSLDTGIMKEISKQGNREVCSYFEFGGVGSFRPSSRYGMSWAGPCLFEDPCLVRVAMWSPMTDENGFPIEHDPNGNVAGDEIKLGFTRVVATLLLDENVCNPFTLSGPLLITDISIRVQRPGNSHKVMADCQWEGPGIEFSIMPQ